MRWLILNALLEVDRLDRGLKFTDVYRDIAVEWKSAVLILSMWTNVCINSVDPDQTAP